MSLPLSCACGARFEVEEAFSGQSVACPECQQSIKVPLAGKARLRTSGYALASVVLALVGMFTIVLSAIAVVLGFIGLTSIARHRDQVTGTGYAVFGILLGVIFTGVTLFGITREEIFDQFREKVRANEADYSGAMEIVRPQEGFAITRPSPRWGVWRDANEDQGLVLVNVGKDAYVQVLGQFARPDETIDGCMDDFIARLREPNAIAPNHKKMAGETTAVHVHESKRLPDVDGMQALEVRVDLRQAGIPLTYVIQVRKRVGRTRAYVLSCWAHRRRFARAQPEMRQAIASFRLLKKE